MRGAALLGFGHLARTAGVVRESALVARAVEAGLIDPDPAVSGQAEAAADDLEHFLGWTLKRAASREPPPLQNIPQTTQMRRAR